MALQVAPHISSPVGPSRMPMNLRSSAPNTPNKPRGATVTPNTTPTRKPPHCRKCKRPRVGHPRSGCPYVEENNPAPTREATAEPDNHIAHALSSLHITPPLGPENTAANKENAGVGTRPSPAAQPRATATRLSLSTTAGEVFQRLRAGENQTRNEPSPPYYDLSLSRRQSRIARIEEWQHSVAVAMESTESDTDGSGNCSGPLNVDHGASEEGSRSNVRSRGLGLKNPNGALSLSSRSRASDSNDSARRPLVRSMSMEEREAFVKSLNEASDATVYVLPKADIHEVNATAVKLGFRTRIVMNEGDGGALKALLVLARE